MRTTNKKPAKSQRPKREYWVSAKLVFIFNKIQLSDTYRKVARQIHLADKECPWTDHDDVGNPVTSMGSLIENPGNLPNGSSSSVIFLIFPHERHMSKTQVYAYEKYLRKVAEVVSGRIIEIKEFVTEITLRRQELCNLRQTN